MVRKYFLQQLGLLLMVSVIMVLTNILGYKMPVGDSIAGILVIMRHCSFWTYSK